VAVVVEVVGSIDCVVVMMASYEGCYLTVGWWRDGVVWRRWDGVGLLALLLLLKDINSVLQLCEPCSLLVDALPPGFGMLSDCPVPHYLFLFLSEPLYLMLDSNQFLLLYRSFDFLSFLIPVLHLDLIRLRVVMNDQRR
jgi:hypothetical protein